MYVQMFTGKQAHAYAYECIHTKTRTHVQTHIHTHKQCTHTQTCTHTHTETYLHMHIHMHIHVYMPKIELLLFVLNSLDPKLYSHAFNQPQAKNIQKKNTETTQTYFHYHVLNNTCKKKKTNLCHNCFVPGSMSDLGMA